MWWAQCWSIEHQALSKQLGMMGGLLNAFPVQMRSSKNPLSSTNLLQFKLLSPSQEMQGQHPVMDAMLEHRALSKQLGMMGGLLETLSARNPHMQRIINLATVSLFHK